MSLSSLNSRISAIESKTAALNNPGHKIIIDWEQYQVNFLNGLVYTPNPTSKLFHESNVQRKLIMGPYGSGKSVTCCMETLFKACKMPKCKDGIRRSRFYFIRATYKELRDTTFKTWSNWFANVGVTKVLHSPPMEYHHRIDDGNGIVEFDVHFLALESQEDIDKLKSLEVSYIFLNEASELVLPVFQHAYDRTSRYPMEAQLPPDAECDRGVFMDTNPPDTDSWIYDMFEKGRDGHKIFKQPPGLLKVDGKWIKNPNAENISHLRDKDYYLNNAMGRTEEYIRVYCCGEYGIVLDGKVVYPQYNDDAHSVETIEVIPDNPIIMGFDFGLTPACLMMQLIGSQLRVFKEFTTDRMGIEELAGSIVKPYLSQHYPKYHLISTCDPSGVRGMDTDTSSCLQILHKIGFKTFPAYTNGITARIESVNSYINRMSSGKPAFLISRTDCPNLRKGFLGKYCYKRIRVLGQEKFNDLPDKTHPFSDIHDCLQYGALYCNKGLIGVNSSREFNYKSNSMWL